MPTTFQNRPLGPLTTQEMSNLQSELQKYPGITPEAALGNIRTRQTLVSKGMTPASVPPQPTGAPQGGFQPQGGTGYQPLPSPPPGTQGGAQGAPGGAGTSQASFYSAMQQLLQRGQGNEAIRQQKNSLLMHLYDRALTPEELRTLSPDQQDAIRRGDKNLLELQVMSMNDTLKGRDVSNTQALQYLMQGYELDREDARRAMEESEKKKQQSITALLSLADKFDLSKADPGIIERIQNGTFTGADIQSLSGFLRRDEEKAQFISATQYQQPGVFDPMARTFTPVAGGAAPTEGLPGGYRQERADRIIAGIDVASGLVNSTTAGLGGTINAKIPGTPAYNLARELESIKANIGFNELQAMREASKTGGALGQVAVQELNFLQSVLGSLDQGQDAATLKANLARVKQSVEGSVQRFNAAVTKATPFAGATTPQLPVGQTPAQLGTWLRDLGIDPTSWPQMERNGYTPQYIYDQWLSKKGGSASTVGHVGTGRTVAERHNNPLNIKYGRFAAGYGATQGQRATDGGVFATFPDVQTGLQAARDLLTGSSYRDLTLEQAMRRWSGSGYGADVAPQLGNRRIRDLSKIELDYLIQQMHRREVGSKNVFV